MTCISHKFYTRCHFENSLGIKIFNGPPQHMKNKQAIIRNVTKSKTIDINLSYFILKNKEIRGETCSMVISARISDVFLWLPLSMATGKKSFTIQKEFKLHLRQTQRIFCINFRMSLAWGQENLLGLCSLLCHQHLE